MKKVFHLSYLFIGNHTREIKTESLFEFSQQLDKALEEETVIQSTITFWTEEVEVEP